MSTTIARLCGGIGVIVHDAGFRSESADSLPIAIDPRLAVPSNCEQPLDWRAIIAGTHQDRFLNSRHDNQSQERTASRSADGVRFHRSRRYLRPPLQSHRENDRPRQLSPGPTPCANVPRARLATIESVPGSLGWWLHVNESVFDGECSWGSELM